MTEKSEALLEKILSCVEVSDSFPLMIRVGEWAEESR